MSRRGTTLVEALVAAALGMLVLFALVCVAQLASHSSRAGAQSAALADAALVLATLERDLMQALPGGAARFQGRTLTLAVARRGPGDTLATERVAYTKVDAGDGLWRLVRTAGGRDAPLPGTYRAIHIAQWSAAGGPYVRVTLAAAARPERLGGRPVPGADDVVLGSLVRMTGSDASVKMFHN